MRTPPDKTITLTFASHQVKDTRMRWAVNLTFAPGIGEGDSLEISAEDGEGEPVESAVFEFAGRRVPIAGGRGSIPYADFVRGKHEKGIWLSRPGRESVPGALTFA